jgi:AcrR family transcriptional regulator
MRAAGRGRTADDTRRLILDSAYQLFYRHGFARVALDAIAERAGVTKRTLYYHFRSKDDLLAAVLDAHSELALARIRRWGERLPAEIDAAIDALFAELARWAKAPDFEGAGYTRIVMELADLPGHPARQIARRHKAQVEAWLAGELSRRGVAASEERAREIQMLLEGAMALMLVHGEPRYAVAAAKAAKSLLREAALTLPQATASGAPGT